MAVFFYFYSYRSMKASVVCPICGNDDPTGVFLVNQTIVCKQCIHYVREALTMNELVEDPNIGDYQLKYDLSIAQKNCAQAVLDQIKAGNDVLLWAVCGAGKTEMIMDSIQYTLSMGGRVGFLIPRRQVVLEVKDRLAKAFSNAKVVAVCAGYGSDLIGDIVVATTHQAVRYPKAFDLLILDEPDAFPYKGNKILEKIVERARKGRMIYSTATPGKSLLNMVKTKTLSVVELNSRYTGKPMVVPVAYYGFNWMLWLYIIGFIKTATRSILLFVPTIALAKRLYTWFKPWISCNYLTSKTEDKETIIESFRNKEYPLLIATSVLERGVTFIDIDVLIYLADHPVFDQAALQQMAGRVGRHPVYYQGRCVFLCKSRSEAVNQCIERIAYANQSLSMV